MKKLILAVGAALLCFVLAAPTQARTSAEEAFAVVPAPKGKTATVTFKTSMHCKNCVRKINDNIAFEKGVKDLKVSLDKKTVVITYDPAKTTEEALAAAIRKLGYEVQRQEPLDKRK